MRMFAAAVVGLAILPGAAGAHSIDKEITDCRCSAACYTDEVSRLSCGSTVSMRANGLPDTSHPVMTGITASNQQFPVPHDYTHSFPKTPRASGSPVYTEPGPVGVAVNGIPIFDPSTQGPEQAATGKPVSAAAAGELDSCGGHAGRGDDYHYHIAPKCLIDELGKTAIEQDLRPIGFASDGFPIMAIGWFDRTARIEGKLDACRGATDASGAYFYNVEPGGDYAVLNCFTGTPRASSGDKTKHRTNPDGSEYNGIPIAFKITGSTRGTGDCHIMAGRLSDAQVMQTASKMSRVSGQNGAVFYCSKTCYGYFTEVDAPGTKGRVLRFERALSGCPAGMSAATENGFLSYWDGQ